MATSTENRYLTGNFAPVSEEVVALDLPVTGAIPTELEGRYLRNGPNPIGPVDLRTHHWFIGTGMVHGVRLRDGKAEWYRNRFVRGDDVAAAQGLDPLPGPRHPMFGGGAPNTNVIGHAGSTWAIVEAGGHPVELTYELDSVRYLDFDGAYPGSFSAHPKKDPVTGELHVMAYYWEWDHVKYVVVRPDGRIRKVVEVPVPGAIMLHDVAITESSIVIFDLPVTFQLDALAEGYPFPYRWDDGYQPRVGVLSREGRAEDVRWAEVEPVLRLPPDERLRPAGRADRHGRGAPPADVRHRRQRPVRGPAHARPLDHRRRGGQGGRGADRRPRAGVPPGGRAPGRQASPLRLRRLVR